MLKSITLQNFRSIRDRTRIQIGELTILVGANSVGKSTIFEAIQFLRYAVNGDASSLMALIRSAEHRESGGKSSMYGVRPWGPLLCGASFIFDEITKQTRFSKDYDEAVAVKVEDDYPAELLVESLEGSEVEVLFSPFEELILKQNGQEVISIDDHLYFWDGKDSFLCHEDIEWDAEEFRGKLTINPKTPLGLKLKDVFDDIPVGWPPTTLGNALWREARDNYTFYGIQFDGYERHRINIPFSRFFHIEWGASVDFNSFFAGRKSITPQEEKSIRRRCAKDSKKSWPLRSYAEYRELIAEIIGAVLKILYRRIYDHLDMPHVAEERSQIGLGVFKEGDESCPSHVWNYAEALSNRAVAGNFLAQKLRAYLREKPFLGKYEVASDIWILKNCGKSYRGRARESPDLPKIASFFLIDVGNRHLSFDEVGSGMSCIFPILASIGGKDRFYGRVEHAIFVQQPELHLHPSAQCELADLFIWFLQNGGSAIVETHSEHFILRLLKRVRQEFSSNRFLDEQALSERMVIHSFQQDHGRTMVRTIRVARNGDFLDDWPGGFFAEREGELFDE